MATTYNLKETLSRIECLIPEFRERIHGAPYEIKGVLFSEMLFLAATVGDSCPARIFESGRARGISTFWLGSLFPKSQIISVELDKDSPDVEYAARILAPLDNVDCRFGDACRILSSEVSAQDIVMIDGPKGWRALRLAFRLLSYNRPRAVFLHDCHRGSLERTFLDRRVPEAFYSDQPDFVEATREVDAPCWTQRADRGIKDFPKPYHGPSGPCESYGPTLACLPGSTLQNASRRLLWAVRIEGVRDRLSRSLRKRVSTAF